MTNLWILDFLKFAFGGHIYQQKVKERHKNAWIWQIFGKDAVTFLESILPYLKLKRPEAEIAIDFQTNRYNRKHKITNAERAIEETQVLLVKQLKNPVG
jgi:hypothetical protein